MNCIPIPCEELRIVRRFESFPCDRLGVVDGGGTYTSESVSNRM